MKRHLGIMVVAALMVLFGIAEMATGFTGNFVGILSIDQSAVSTYGAVIVGALYAAGGLLLLPLRKREARVSLVCLLLVIVGRATLVLIGAYPFVSALQIVSILVGTAIAVIFAVYIKLSWKGFS